MQILRQAASQLRGEAASLLQDVGSWEPEARKAPGWAKEDEAGELERQARHKELEGELLLEGAMQGSWQKELKKKWEAGRSSWTS